MLYYPGFEAQDINWLKFALLYLDEIRPIIPMIPYDKETYLSSHTIQIIDETNLIRPYQPDYDEGAWASQKAIEEFEQYLQYPHRYGGRFGHPYHNTNSYTIRDKWRNRSTQNYTLYNGKFSQDFHDFCILEGIASECDFGIKINEDLAYLYMSFLAERISILQEMDSITDSSKYNNLLLNRNKKIAKRNHLELQYAQSNIEINLPKNISQIPLNTIIELRSSNDFNQLRYAYVSEIKNLIVAKENNTPGYSLTDLLSYKSDFIRICENSFEMLGSIILTTYGINQLLNGNLDSASFLNVAAGAYIDSRTIPNFINNLPHSIENINEKHLTRKYLAQINNLS
ncbi:hypothetical protein acsn021_04560 [Anaerocolumna cellulosilytica]|uniref:Uncharacterized protein n=1 Tax=Anaerocolumna cellulosilytica TaxID=433286 RepID=A0A6S6QYD2_9FIRM|nr:hypothetical protein [Anaerocolumna cellulosilytica]MBB5195777.1 hypothetical protein [Anaerocolumna cellulosilytica]BCJ92887.1 hypothetical protein acsn021_04560 [Anaerocolumna cellulosilytica]